MEKSRKTNLILAVIAAVLLVLFIVSLFTKNYSRDSRKSLKTALVNSKYENTISNFTLQKGDSILFLRKVGDLWLVSQKEEANYIPADSAFVQNFIHDLVKIVNLYQVSDSLHHKDDFGLLGSEAFSVKYDQNELIFGDYDFSKTSRYLMTSKNTKVYETDTSLDKYLSTSIQNWSDPYIIARSIKKLTASDVQGIRGTNRKDCNVEKLLELRHGGAAISQGSEKPELSFTLDLGDTSAITLTFYEVDLEIEYNVNVKYDLKMPPQNYDFTVKISGWTYSKIKEIML